MESLCARDVSTSHTLRPEFSKTVLQPKGKAGGFKIQKKDCMQTRGEGRLCPTDRRKMALVPSVSCSFLLAWARSTPTEPTGLLVCPGIERKERTTTPGDTSDRTPFSPLLQSVSVRQ